MQKTMDPMVDLEATKQALTLASNEKETPGPK